MPPATSAPIELHVPNGVTVEPSYLESLRGVAARSNFTREQAQAALDLHLQQRQFNAKAADDASAALKASWDADLAKDYPGPALKEASDRIGAFVKTRLPGLHDYLMVQGAHKHPELFRYFDAAAKLAAETGTMRPANAPAPAASVDPNDWSATYTHPTSKAALAAEKA